MKTSKRREKRLSLIGQLFEKLFSRVNLLDTFEIFIVFTKITCIQDLILEKVQPSYIFKKTVEDGRRSLELIDLYNNYVMIYQVLLIEGRKRLLVKKE